MSFSFGQTKEDVSKITANYDFKKMDEMKEHFEKLDAQQREKAFELAKINNWPTEIISKDGSTKVLVNVTDDGHPIYLTDWNVNAGISSRANQLHNGGAMGLNLEGQNMQMRIWEINRVRLTHTLFGGRVTNGDTGGSQSDHASHVTGTILAAQNATNTTKGMAPQATAKTFNYTNDEAEALAEAQAGMLLSNHSYGVPLTDGTNFMPAWYVGAYSTESAGWDDVANAAPYYLMVVAAGNDGSDNTSNSNPIKSGYDKLMNQATSKNNLVVASCADASVDANGNLTAALSISSFSNQGPTDDYRIKPDITGNGAGLTSCISTSDTATASFSGTSMASPNVAGTLLLVQQHHNNVNSQFMKAATLKGLACHTADDGGLIGPDPKFGWGLINAKKMVQTINNNQLTSLIEERTLSNNTSYQFTVKSDGVNPLIASISWTDPTGNYVNSSVPPNTTTPVLVNDLDIRITRNSTTSYPWKLGSAATDFQAIRTGDNNVDNIEVIKIDAPVAGDYTVTISHKGNLVNNNQDYSLIITGITSNAGLISTSSDLIKCNTDTAVYTFKYKQNGAGTANFNATGLPPGAVATFSPTTMSANGDVTLTISNLTNALNQEYTININTVFGSETKSTTKQLYIYRNDFQNVTINNPVNNSISQATNLIFNWNTNTNAESYTFQLSTASDFSTLLGNVNTTTNSLSVTDLANNTQYYWRVISNNRCGTQASNLATVFTFKTGTLSCGNIFSPSAANLTAAIISATNATSLSIPISVTGGLIIGDINFNLSINHTYPQDLTVYLEGPAAIGSPRVYLLVNPCAGVDNISNFTLDDSASAYVCSPTAPALSGSGRPYQLLSNFSNLPADGVWILNVTDGFAGDGGQVTAATISICNTLPSTLGVENEIFESVSVYPNPTNGLLNIDLGELKHNDLKVTVFDLQGRMIKSTNISNNTTIDLSSYEKGVYLVTLENDQYKTTKKIILQ